mgnify:CR=1 FL=1|jgi:hypothetical protein
MSDFTYWWALVFSLFSCFSLQSNAEVPHIFQSNTPALASEVNDNFANLEGKILDRPLIGHPS